MCLTQKFFNLNLKWCESLPNYVFGEIDKQKWQSLKKLSFGNREAMVKAHNKEVVGSNSGIQQLDGMWKKGLGPTKCFK